MNVKLSENIGDKKYALSTNNYIHNMVDDFNKDLSFILKALSLLKEIPMESHKWQSLMNVSFSKANNELYAKKALKAVYWEKVFHHSNIEHFLSERDQKIWRKSFCEENLLKEDYIELPEFDYSSVQCTVSSWYENSENFFVDRVDSVFDTLSSGHLTNHPNGFNRKMIFSNWCEKMFFDSSKGRIRSWGMSKIHDLRAIIMIVNGLPLPERGSDYDLLRSLDFKTKIEFDHGLWTMQVFKNGNVHIWVDPETAVLLNSYLAKKYPNILSTKDVPIKKKTAEFSYSTTGLPSDLKDLLNSILNQNVSTAEVQKNTHQEFIKFFGLPVFDFMQLETVKVKTAINSILKTGLPCVKSYQFYPTPEVILEEIQSQIGVLDKDQKLLEPSAGSGAIAQLYPNNFTCFEIYKPFVELLNTKGISALNVDFLKQVGLYEYDKVVLNPPYSKNRCLMHFEHSFNFIKNDGEVYIVAPSGLKAKLEQIANKYDRALTELKAFNSCFDDTAIKTSLFLAS